MHRLERSSSLASCSDASYGSDFEEEDVDGDFEDEERQHDHDDDDNGYNDDVSTHGLRGDRDGGPMQEDKIDDDDDDDGGNDNDGNDNDDNDDNDDDDDDDTVQIVEARGRGVERTNGAEEGKEEVVEDGDDGHGKEQLSNIENKDGNMRRHDDSHHEKRAVDFSKPAKLYESLSPRGKSEHDMVLEFHSKYGLPKQTVYRFGTTRKGLPNIRFVPINGRAEYQEYGQRGRKLPGTMRSPESAKKPQQQDPFRKESKMAPISPTGKVRRGSTLRTHVPGCTCASCRRARARPAKVHTRLAFRMLGSTEAKIVVSSLQKNGFVQIRRGDAFHVMWTTQQLKSYDYQALRRHQRINQFPRTHEITRKDTLCRNIARMKETHGERFFSFVPAGFVLPAEMDEFTQAFRASGRRAWIVKPAALSCGRGIFVTDSIAEIRSLNFGDSNWQVSEYIDRPLLIDGYKFDLRIYAAVTSFNPLRVYIHEDGLARFATVKYDGSDSAYGNRYIHLTNYSVNKQNKDFVKNEREEEDGRGSKWSLRALRQRLRKMGIDDNAIWKEIHEVIAMAFISIEAQVNAAIDMFVPFKNQNCFQLFGFDILIDQDLHPNLIEINFSPSLACGTPLDLGVKSRVIADTLSLAGIQPWDEAKAKALAARAKKARGKSTTGKSSLRRKQKQKKKKHTKKTTMRNDDNNGKNCTVDGEHPCAGAAPEKQKSPPSPTKLNFSGIDTSAWTIDERRAVHELEAEARRSGGYERIFPTAESFRLRRFFEESRPLNEALWHYLSAKHGAMNAQFGGEDLRGGKAALRHERSMKLASRRGASTRKRDAFRYVF
eukprot:g951.t1